MSQVATRFVHFTTLLALPDDPATIPAARTGISGRAPAPTRNVWLVNTTHAPPWPMRAEQRHAPCGRLDLKSNPMAASQIHSGSSDLALAGSCDRLLISPVCLGRLLGCLVSRLRCLCLASRLRVYGKPGVSDGKWVTTSWRPARAWARDAHHEARVRSMNSGQGQP